MSAAPSLQKRLAFGLTLALVVVMACQWGVASLTIRHLTQAYVESRLVHDAESLLAALDPTGPQLNPARVATMYARPWSGHYFWIRVGDTVLRSRSLWDADLTFPEDPEGREVVITANAPRSGSMLILVRRYVKQDTPVLIAVAEEMSDFDRNVRMLQVGFAGISLVAIVLLLVLQRRLLRRALQPLDAAGGEVRRLERGEVATLSLAGAPGEILPFLEAINRLLATLQARLERSRQAAGNMAHAIKTPLTLLMQLAESRELEAHHELRGKCVAQVERIRAITSRELKKVRLSGGQGPARHVDATRELTGLAEAMRRMHRARGLGIEVRLPPELVVRMDREDLLELAGNLLDNACKWARERVVLTVTGGEAWRLQVEDDGAGCAPEHHARILERGERADTETAGQGIGLAVVAEIVADYGGRLELGVSGELGGFRVVVLFPASQRAPGKESSES
ncbi:MAG: sensor histidine kinase [Magnetococcales bacterium]|nr:sensor histidine kinase [Magnetococcales bacterium]